MRQILSIVLLCSFTTLFACKDDYKGPVVNQTVAVDEYEKKMNELHDIQLVDVRTTEEFNAGHLKNARNINIGAKDFNEQIASLNKTRPVFVYCKSGGRSGQAAEKLKEFGFKQVYNMDGGIMKWQAAGKPVETGSAPTTEGMSMDDLTKQVAKGYVLVDYNAKWCAPCKKMSPILDGLADKKKGKLTLLKIDADENPVLLNQKKIEGIPYLELYKDGQLIWKHEGYIEEAQLLTETQL